MGAALAAGCRGARARNAARDPWRWYLFVVVSANLPDIDYFAGLLVGDINRYHQGPTHSLFAAGVFGAVLSGWFATRRQFRSWTIVVGVAAYLSHLLLDSLSRDVDAAYGIPLLWPFTDLPVAAPFGVFLPIQHGVPGQGLGSVLQRLLSWDTATAILVEIAVLAPLVIAALAFRRWGSRARSSSL